MVVPGPLARAAAAGGHCDSVTITRANRELPVAVKPVQVTVLLDGIRVPACVPLAVTASRDRL